MLPIIMAVSSSSLFVEGIHLDVVTIVLISMAICMLIETLRLRDFKISVCRLPTFSKGYGFCI